MKLTTHEPGIYFGMPEDEYHADPSFSSSVAKDVLVSPLTAWCGHYDPDRDEDDDTAAQVKGKALHKAVLEGQEAFDARYAVQPDPDDYPDHLKGADQLRAKCEELGLAKGGSIAAMAKRIMEKDSSVKLWPDVVSAFAAGAGDRITLTPDVGKYVNRTADMVSAHPSVRKAVTGGYPEVSIFWHADGIPWKCRLDYLKTRAAVDLKTFTNIHKKPLDVAVAHAVAQHRYHLQAYIYMQGLMAAHALPIKTASMPADDWQRDWRDNGHDPRFIFLFVESGRVPNVALREFRRKNADGQTTLAYQSGEAAARQAAGIWQSFMGEFGPDQPWVSDAPLQPFADEEFPLYMMD